MAQSISLPVHHPGGLAGGETFICTRHRVHCGGVCMLKLWMKDGRLSRITSAGDMPRAGSAEADEDIADLMQRRGCIKGYAEGAKLYAPDRLKYPLLQTGQRGDIRGFKRINWDQALDTVAGWYAEMLERKNDLGYLPIWDAGGVGAHLGPYLKRYGSMSTGNGDAAMHYAIGDGSRHQGTAIKAMLRANYVVVWGRDPQASAAHAPFIMTKAKEAGIPVTLVESRYTPTAAAMTTGTGAVPPVVGVRPGTDGALLAAMCNVIYRKGLHDEAFIRDYCFGFYPGDSTVSQSDYVDPISGQAARGRLFATPEGQSFVEYLDSLQAAHGGYAGVLAWAERLCGTPAGVIEHFAVEVATRRPVYWGAALHGGPQRQVYGMYYSWLVLAITAMTGNFTLPGGGYGKEIDADGFFVQLPPAGDAFTTAEKHAHIPFNHTLFDEMMLTSRDGRTPAQLRADTLAAAGIDLGEDARLHCEMFVRGAGVNNIFNQVPNINKRRLAFAGLRHTLCYERQMTSTAMFSDIVLPVVTDLEDFFLTTGMVGEPGLVQPVAAPMYECRTDRWINTEIARRLGLPVVPVPNPAEAVRRQYAGAALPQAYQKLRPNAKLPTLEQLSAEGNHPLSVTPEEVPDYNDPYLPGAFPSDTGRINFFSPTLHSHLERAPGGAAGPRYVPLEDGFEAVSAPGGYVGAKGLAYTLQFITPHMTQRANSYMDDVPMVKDRFGHAVWLAPADAEKRGLADGDEAYVYSDYGCIRLPVRVTRQAMAGVAVIPQGTFYRPSRTQRYQAWFDADGDGVPEPHDTPVDLGGNPNVITGDRVCGVANPHFSGLGMNAGGHACEVSRTHPDTGLPAGPREEAE